MDRNEINDNSVPRPAFVTPALSAAGVEFDPNTDFWKLDRTACLNFEKLVGTCTDRFFHQVKSVAKILVETGNAYSAAASLVQFRAVCLCAFEKKLVPIDVIDNDDLLTWLLRGSNRNYVSQLRILTEVAKTFEANLLTGDAQYLLDNMKVNGGSNAWNAVRAWDPKGGALRPAEDQVLATSINDAFTAGEMSLRAFFIVRMIRGFALRPSMLAAMKVCDIRHGEGGMHLRIPKAKQRGIQMRGEFMPWKPVSAGLADIIRIYLTEEVYPFVAPDRRDNAPLVWIKKMKKNAKKMQFDATIKSHANKDDVRRLYKVVTTRLEVRSPITGDILHLHPRRERSTYATHLAMNGATAAEIAINLGQSSVDSCQPYIDATVAHFQSIENAVGTHYVAVGDRFIGNIMSKDRDPAEFRIVNHQANDVGTCRINGCSAVDAGVAPFACYTCRKFNAWEEAPHEEILDSLLKEQISRRKDNHPEHAETITDTIVAINDLIERIHQKRRVS